MFIRLLTLSLLILMPASACGQTTISAPYAAASAARGEVTIIDVRSPSEWRQTRNPRGDRTVRILSAADFNNLQNISEGMMGLPTNRCPEC